TDKLYWFTTGLGVDYISFTSIIRASRPAPSFQDLVAQAESHEAQCEVNSNSASWYADSGATDHMAKSSGSGNEAGLGSRSM
nr:zinc finger, CCHC-type, Gag-polypeptide of LTR copia-type [Tanacetum cinerariifolium]